MKRAEFYSVASRNLGLFQYLYLAYQKRARHSRPFKLYSKKLKFPITVRPKTSDFSVFYQVLVFDEYRCVSNLRPELIIDLGANVGYSSAYFLSRFPNCRVIAVEPDPANFRELQKNLFPYQDRAKAIQAAVWPRIETLSLNHPGQGEEWGVRVNAEPTGTISAVTVPDLIRLDGAKRVSLLKIDIEGSEVELFRSNTEWLDQVDNIVIELHGEAASEAFLSRIEKSRFDISNCDELTVCLSRLG